MTLRTIAGTITMSGVLAMTIAPRIALFFWGELWAAASYVIGFVITALGVALTAGLENIHEEGL